MWQLLLPRALAWMQVHLGPITRVSLLAHALLGYECVWRDLRPEGAVYDGPVDGTIGGQDLRNLPPVHVSAIPYNFGDTFSGQNNLKLLSRVGGHASTATAVSNINQGGVGLPFVSSFYGK